MLRYGVSMNTVGGRMTPELAGLFRESPVKTVEVILAALEQDDRDGGPSRRLFRELQADGAIRAESLHLPYFGVWDVSALDETVRRESVRQITTIVERNLEFGPRYLTLHSSAEPIADAARRAHLDQASRSVADMVPFLQRHNLKLSVELLPRTCIGHDEGEIRAIVDRFDPACVGICLDVNHVMSRAAELPRIIEALADRLYTLHISDYDGIDERHWFPGEGVIAWPAVMDALRRTGRDLLLLYEIRPDETRDRLGNLRRVEESIAFLDAAGSV